MFTQNDLQHILENKETDDANEQSDHSDQGEEEITYTIQGNQTAKSK